MGTTWIRVEEVQAAGEAGVGGAMPPQDHWDLSGWRHREAARHHPEAPCTSECECDHGCDCDCYGDCDEGELLCAVAENAEMFTWYLLGGKRAGCVGIGVIEACAP